MCFVATGALCVAGCASTRSVAAQQFAQQFACPEDRVQVIALPRDAPHKLLLPAQEPPADVAADATRLRLWRKQREAAEAQVDSTSRAFVVTGCGQQRRYVCGSDVDADDGNYGVCVEGDPDLVVRAYEQMRLGEVWGLGLRVGPGAGAAGGGASVESVTPKGPSDGKLQAGDVIVSVNDGAVAGIADLVRASVLAWHAGSSLRLSVLRRGATIATEVRPTPARYGPQSASSP